jgi:phosphatidylinositol alpha-1,6-mannosyltransferase
LSALGWEVVVQAPQDYALEEEIQSFNTSRPFGVDRVRHYPNSLLEGTGRFANLARLARGFRPHVILASGGRAVWLTAVHSHLRGSTWVAIAHGGIEFGTPVGWQRLASRWAYSQPRAVVCVSEYARRRMLDLGVRPARTGVITNGADDSIFQQTDPEKVRALRREWGLEQAQLILTVGSLSERKGQEIVVRALPMILDKRPGVHYIMAGLPQTQSRLEQIARGLGVEKNIHFLGRVDQSTLVTAYHASDLFVMTSRLSADGDAEGYGIAVIEAALCGRPAVVSGGSGLAEVVIDGETGLQVPENDPSAAAQAILCLLCNDSLRLQMGNRARARALREQTWQSRVPLYDGLLREILAAG